MGLFINLSRHRRLLRARSEEPRRRAAEQGDELAPLQSIELHSVPRQPGPDCQYIELRGVGQRVLPSKILRVS